MKGTFELVKVFDFLPLVLHNGSWAYGMVVVQYPETRLVRSLERADILRLLVE